jgi:hypothetical protein
MRNFKWEQELISWVNGRKVEFSDGGKWCLLAPILGENSFLTWIGYPDRQFRIARDDRERIDSAVAILNNIIVKSSAVDRALKELTE